MPTQQTNTGAVVGFCLMILGWLSCGVMSIPALFVCWNNMSKEPRTLAVAGFVLSIPPALFLVCACLLYLAGGAAESMAEQRRINRENQQHVLEK